MTGKPSGQPALCIRISGHVDSPLVFREFVAVDIIGSFNPFHIPVGKNHVAARLAVVVLTARILVEATASYNAILRIAGYCQAAVVVQKSQIFAGPAACPRRLKALLWCRWEATLFNVFLL